MPLNWTPNYWIKSLTVGDKVEILPKFPGLEELAFGDGCTRWNSSMDETVGKIGKVIRIYDGDGWSYDENGDEVPFSKIVKVKVRFAEDIGERDFWYYPPSMLRKVS